MKKRLVIALGGNALGNTPEQQLELVKTTAKTIVDLSEAGYDIIVGHGNGPQVGMINLAMDFSANNGGKTPYMPFPECGAMSQGYIGYHLQQAIQEELKKRGIKKECATVVTQVVVDEHGRRHRRRLQQRQDIQPEFLQIPRHESVTSFCCTSLLYIACNTVTARQRPNVEK